MNKRYHVMIFIIAVMLVLTACSSGGQTMDGEDMVRSYKQISQEEAKQLMEQDGTQIILVYDILINCTFYKSYDIIQTRQSEGPLYEIHA